MKTTKRESLAALVDVSSSKKIGNNTFRIKYTDDREAIRLHHTDVITFHPGGIVEYDTGGRKTVTTKDRINGYGPAHIYSKNGIWHLDYGGSSSIFYDGIKIDPLKGILDPKEDVSKSYLKTKKQIADFVSVCKAKLEKHGILEPSPGDCWICSMFEKAGMDHDTEHLVSHMKEKYIHGSLILNALKHVGYRDPAFIAYGARSIDSICRAMRRFLNDRVLRPMKQAA